MRLPAELLVGKTEEQKQAFIEGFKACRSVRDELAGVLTKKLESAIIELESKKLLDSPNYSETIADTLGYRRGLRFTLALLRPETDL